MSEQSPRENEPPAERPNGRADDEIRPVSIELDPLKFASGSAMIRCGDTQVLAAAAVEKRVPPFRQESGLGWVTAEYSMLPQSTPGRNRREVSMGRPSGRTAEIQRLIGRSLRAAVDFRALAEHTVTIDCDVLQADGGTRTASITAAWVALVSAVAKSYLQADLPRWPVREQVAAVSVGLWCGRPVVDLEYAEDSTAEVDLNVVAYADGRLVEIQGTGEQRAFERRELDALLDLAQGGIEELADAQRSALSEVLASVEAAGERRRRGPAPPQDESEIWK